MTNLYKLFILVDDDPLSNLLLKKVIEKNLEGAEVKDFNIPEIALDYIETDLEHHPFEEKITLFLDINMPTLTGWEFLEKFETFKKPIKNQFNIYILSSSIDPADIQCAQLNPLVLDFIEKPINKDFLIKTFSY
ncbi:MULTISPECIES: response regulator [unclassified Arenibacter]|jgi:two-component SAPR family response regulator|uniref:response regulator n=1 Tax=unclassified Arenibacter TaxID=2615047 RepID=UPI000E351C49|nr:MULTISPECIES: response regulator [unclassified Arenibacter]MCM4162676.1 response regulator [Arenibacter sp. A80]RFT58241.1 response regulator [Arenibacter sp. P308M17]